jgi:hypothetical protein
MKVMDEKNRNRIINEAKKFGGIGLRSQKLRIHNNGAKFPISKIYIDDKVIIDSTLYTLVLIPEAKISLKSGVILSYFRRKVGPIAFYVYPEKVFTEKEKEIASDLMKTASEGKFFTYQTDFFSSINYYFEINSSWARGNKEMLLLTVVLTTQIDEIIEHKMQQLCRKFEKEFIKTENIFKGIYLDEIERLEEKEKQEIKIKAESIRLYIKEFKNTVDNMVKSIKKT